VRSQDKRLIEHARAVCEQAHRTHERGLAARHHRMRWEADGVEARLIREHAAALADTEGKDQSG
jgi:hypothetical protein